MEVLAIVLISIQVSAVVVSAFFWNKIKFLRKSPIAASLLCGIIYNALTSDLNSSFLSIMLASLFIGIGFYFSVWIQCKNKNDTFI